MRTRRIMACIMAGCMLFGNVSAVALGEDVIGTEGELIEITDFETEEGFTWNDQIGPDEIQEEHLIEEPLGNDNVDFDSEEAIFDEDLEPVTENGVQDVFGFDEVLVKEDAEEAEPHAAGVYQSGMCGENLTWTLDYEGTMTISGTGPMYHCDFYPMGIKTVIIENGVTSIAERVFNRCSDLTSITIPSSVTCIEYGAFTSCYRLTSIKIPSSVTSIGGAAFYDCTNLTSITIPSGVTSIGKETFFNCFNLTSISIPSSVTSIGIGAFNNCTSLKSVTIPISVATIGRSAFDGCTSLEDITIPDGVTSIGDNTFCGCTSLEDITVPDSVTSIGESAFSGCTSLTDITIPDSITSIGKKAFYNCTSLADIFIPDSVTSIGESAFYGCTSLTGVNIPNSVKLISDKTFYNCTSLADITIPNSITYIGANAFYNCTSLTDITIPRSVTSIDYYAFYNCTSLTSITIPFSVTQIQIVYGRYSVFEGIDLSQLTIYGHTGSYAEQYAAKFNIQFVPLRPITVVSLGDSFSSGEGNETFYGQKLSLEQKVENEDWLAHRSTVSWPGQLKIPGVPGMLLEYKYDDPTCTKKLGVCKWYFKASSGAETKDFNGSQIKPVRQKGIRNHELYVTYLKPQLRIFDEIEGTVDVVTLTIGGNDVGFTEIIEKVFFGSNYFGKEKSELEKMLDEKWENINEYKKRLKNTYKEIRRLTSSDTLILVAGYPELLDASSWKTTGLVANKDEAVMVNGKVRDFNDAIEEVVTDCHDNEGMNIYFVDVEEEFKGNQKSWINPIYIGSKPEDLNDRRISSAYSVHPTGDGIKAYADCVNKMIKDKYNRKH